MEVTPAEEELEPLFDYSRVQPVDFVAVDDEDCFESPPFTVGAKRKKCSNAAGKESNIAVVLDDDKGKVDEEEDWLPPPPPLVADPSSELAEDLTIKELRLKKLELASFAQSAEDVMRAVIESAKKEVHSSGQSVDLEVEVEESTKSKVDRPKVLISIQDKDGQKQFRVFKDDKFERVFKMYADRINCNLERLVFCFDGDKVSPCATPDSLGMEDDDIIEVHLKSR